MAYYKNKVTKSLFLIFLLDWLCQHTFPQISLTDKCYKSAAGHLCCKAQIEPDHHPNGLLTQSVACNSFDGKIMGIDKIKRQETVHIIPILASCTMSLCSISSLAFSLFSSFCIMLAISTMAPLYTIRLPDSLASDAARAFGEGSRLLFPKVRKNTWIKLRR